MSGNIYEQTNPVSKTAVTTLIQLAAAGYEKSEEILERLGFQDEKEFNWSLGEKDQLEKLCMVTNRESRYRDSIGCAVRRLLRAYSDLCEDGL